MLFGKELSKEIAKATSLEVNSMALLNLLAAPILSGIPQLGSFLFSPLPTHSAFETLLKRMVTKNVGFQVSQPALGSNGNSVTTHITLEQLTFHWSQFHYKIEIIAPTPQDYWEDLKT